MESLTSGGYGRLRTGVGDGCDARGQDGRVTVDPLVAEACRKSGVVWLTVDGQPPRVVWHVWHEGADHVLTGGGEQEVPGLAEAGSVDVAVRAKSDGSLLVRWQAAAEPVEPGSETWETLEPLLRKARLHAEPDPTPRWRERSRLTRLTPR